MDSMTRVSLFLPIELLERLRAVASRRSEPVAHVVRAILEAGAGDHRPLPRGGILP
ncbi:MAG: hypothetical protein J0J03_11290 [Leifsonia sp.]|nr:hypothetical protein [Leifsonia sp.]